MSRFLLFIRTHTYVILLYIISVVVICLLFPREGKYPYEFQKGKIWGHKDLYAPFDVPILKSESEIATETDSILRSFAEYYNYRPEIAEQQKSAYQKVFNTHWENGHLNTYKKKYLYEKGLSLLDSVYKTGIFQGDQPSSDNLSKQVMIIRNNVGEEMNRSDVFTPKTAYSLIISQLDLMEHEEERNFLKGLDLNEFLQPNVFYNAEITNTAKSESIKKISPTKGVIPTNRKIIANGEIVNDEKFIQLTSLKYEFEHKVGTSGNFSQILVGQISVITLCFMLVYIYLMFFRKDIFRSTLRTGFLLLMMVMFVGISCLVVRNGYFSLYNLPFILIPIIICTFFDARTATFIFMVSTLLIGFLAPNGFEFIFLNFIAGIVGIVNVQAIYRRGTLFRAVLWIIATYSVTYTALIMMQGIKFSQIEWMNYVRFGISGALLFVAYPSIFIFEKIFGFISDITLMELSDTNQPLLRKLSEVAPGTFQHSLQVANISEEVIQKIGGNPLLMRTGALYHDIGKISRPAYFIENQSGGRNPHEDISPENSAQIIIEHVSNGVEIAKKNRIPQHIINFIRTHHGTTTVRFFYHQYQKQHPDQKIDRSKFTYPGPIPFSKEMVILMMCDSIEAASRSLKEINQASISDLVDNIVNYQVLEDQYNDANITYREINTAKQIIKNRLMNIYHVRIEYPKD
ncbi:MAG: HDIG domain-containing protein [Bacteroidales bacterium]|jgi:putative nucleotidyltransferase with HDIG domain|nr:HDIG domain-containing protein [Bacteroidales bacterium]